MRRLDEARRLGIVGQRLANLPDRHLEDGVADERVLPDRADQMLLGHQLPGTAEQVLEDRERLRPQLDGLRPFPEALVHEVEREGIEMNHVTEALRQRYDWRWRRALLSSVGWRDGNRRR